MQVITSGFFVGQGFGAYVFQRTAAGSWSNTTFLPQGGVGGGGNPEYGGPPVDVSGNRAILGSVADQGVGQPLAALASLYERDASGVWHLVTQLVPGHPVTGRSSNARVSIAGDIAAVDQAIYERDAAGTWSRTATLELPGVPSTTRLVVDLAASGRAIASAPGGIAYTFQRQPDASWLPVAKLETSNGSTISAAAIGSGGAIARAGNSAYVFETAQPAGQFSTLNDFNGDGRADILWRNAAAFKNALWFMGGTGISSQDFTTDLDDSWTIAGRGDFNSDGKTDILWRQRDSGRLAVWLMDGARIASSGFLPPLDSSWGIEGVGNFSGDGGADIFLRHSSGTTAIWIMNGTQVDPIFTTSIEMSWSVAAVSNFDSNGTTDVLWRHTSGQTAFWLSAAPAGGVFSFASTRAFGPVVDSSWVSAAAGDFNGDGRGDVLWRHQSGLNAIWFMNGSALSSAYIATLDPAWELVAAGDFDGDSDADIMWSLNGKTAVWLMNGPNIAGSAFGPTLDTAWSARPKPTTNAP